MFLLNCLRCNKALVLDKAIFSSFFSFCFLNMPLALHEKVPYGLCKQCRYRSACAQYVQSNQSLSFLLILMHLNIGLGRVALSVGHLTHKSGVLGSIPGLATYFRFSFRFFKKGSCQLLAKVCARSTG